MNFNEYVPKNRLAKMLGVSTYKFNQLYGKDLPDPIILGGNKIPLYSLEDVDNLLEAIDEMAFFKKEEKADLTDYNKAKRHYRHDMKNYSIPFDEYVTVTEALEFIPVSKQAIQQKDNFLPSVTVWKVKFYHKESLKNWTKEQSRLDRIKFQFNNVRNGEFLKKYKTYDKWLKALNDW